MPDENKTTEQAQAQADAEQKKQQPQQTDVQHTSYGVESASEKAQKIRAGLPTADRNKAYNNIRKYADEHGGLCEGFVDKETGEKIVDPNTGKPYTADALIAEIEYRNAAKVDEKGQVVEKASDWQINAPGIGANGSDSFNFVGNDSKTVQQKKKEEEDKKKEEGSWWSRNWKWLTATIAGLAVVGGVIGWLVHRHNKNKKKKEAAKKAEENTETKLDDKSKTSEVDNAKTMEADNTKTPEQAQAGQQQATSDNAQTPSTETPPSVNITPSTSQAQTPSTPQVIPTTGVTPTVQAQTPSTPQAQTPTPPVTSVTPTPSTSKTPTQPSVPKDSPKQTEHNNDKSTGGTQETPKVLSPTPPTSQVDKQTEASKDAGATSQAAPKTPTQPPVSKDTPKQTEHNILKQSATNITNLIDGGVGKQPLNIFPSNQYGN